MIILHEGIHAQFPVWSRDISAAYKRSRSPTDVWQLPQCSECLRVYCSINRSYFFNLVFGLIDSLSAHSTLGGNNYSSAYGSLDTLVRQAKIAQYFM